MTHIFILCYNESVLLPHTVAHYKRNIPYANITILDNESTDGSQDIARQLGCNVVSWSSQNILNDYLHANLKNNCWKNTTGWVIIIDMDEWLCVTDQELEHELQNGTTILKTKGIDMIGESKNEHVADINLHTLNRYVENHYLNKNVCFYSKAISDINYGCGAHHCNPVGRVQYSFINYLIKHMSFLGLPFYTRKTLERYKRAHEMQKLGMATHYTNDITTINSEYNIVLYS
jgi:glycosyltransferase involved in cell wall biosynthesis